MLYFEGQRAFTSFRLAKHFANVTSLLGELAIVEARNVFFVEVEQDIDTAAQQKIATLLDAQLQETPRVSHDFSFWVTPRIGTISPWSSKATDICHVCGLAQVKRVERGIYYTFKADRNRFTDAVIAELIAMSHDPLVESIILNYNDASELFLHASPRPLQTIEIDQLADYNKAMGLALSAAELHYLVDLYKNLKRDPTDVELMIFAQVNSEHCRHKIFNASWWIDGKEKEHTLFDMIRETYRQHPEQALIAYKDNAAVLKGHDSQRLIIDSKHNMYAWRAENSPFVLKVETHNHPTAISPFAGAATGSGGEIRDELATGRGAFSKAGLCGFSVSHLHIPDFQQPWEIDTSKPPLMASALIIMLEGPIGAASFNNEFGRPNICGYFRSFEMRTEGYYGSEHHGYHKPIMLAGGMGSISYSLIEKNDIPVGAKLVVLGGPGMAIGLGGGSASSRSADDQNQQLDFASVQRSNPEMQRRCYEVIRTCALLDSANPILSIHDVGAGGLCNALPELVHGAGKGAVIDLRSILIDEPNMTPLEIWCNESQERFVLAIAESSVELFTSICKRERCPFSIVGDVNASDDFVVTDPHFNNQPIHFAMPALFEKMPQLSLKSEHAEIEHAEFDCSKINLGDAIKRVLQFPCVADKRFLITIGDRSVGGLIARDQMVGPWQISVADVAVTNTDFNSYCGEAMAMGERAPIALLHPAASARMAVGEAITNIAAAPIADISQIALSANWMSAAKELGEGAALYDAVEAIGRELCIDLGISIPVGKDSMSMKVSWQAHGQQHDVVSPLSVVITAAAPVTDVRAVLTPELNTTLKNSRLLLIDLGENCNALGGSVLAQTYNQLGGRPPDIDNSADLKNFFNLIQVLNSKNLVHAYHDRSDGGLLATISEMMFASHCGITLSLAALEGDAVPLLFNEELGAVIQVDEGDLPAVIDYCDQYHLADRVHIIAMLNETDSLSIQKDGEVLYENSRVQLQRLWSETSYRLQRLRDNPVCAEQEYESLLDAKDPGLNVKLTFDVARDHKKYATKPRVAILREQGVNGQYEMAAAFMRAGFDAVDVHMTDLLTGAINLRDFVGLAACGGFSYGDVLGAGRGWAQSILMNPTLRHEFEMFFKRDNTFTLGVCNGCQMLSQLKSLIPGAEEWPQFLRNTSEQFEARVSLIKIEQTPSIFLTGMAGSVLPIIVSHGEGRAVAEGAQALVSMRFVDHYHRTTETYPFNPNGSADGVTAVTSRDGRALIMMPHPDRSFRTVQHSWHPKQWGEDSPWLQLFLNAREWVG